MTLDELETRLSSQEKNGVKYLSELRFGQKRSKITPIFGAVGRTFIQPYRKQPTTCSIKSCSDCCAAREDDNLFFMAIRKAI